MSPSTVLDLIRILIYSTLKRRARAAREPPSLTMSSKRGAASCTARAAAVIAPQHDRSHMLQQRARREPAPTKKVLSRQTPRRCLGAASPELSAARAPRSSRRAAQPYTLPEETEPSPRTASIMCRQCLHFRQCTSSARPPVR